MTKDEAISTERALKLALEALKHPGNVYHIDCPKNTAITALLKAQAEQPAQQEPSDLDVWKARALQAEAVVAKFMAPQPAQRTWVGLTTADRKEIERQSVYVEGAIRLTEAKLKEKNT